MEGVELDIRHDASEEIAKRALDRKIGARGLRSILEDILLDTMYETPTKKNIKKVVIDGSVVRGESEPLVVYESPDPKTAVSE
jgi:ATP-dependent Clp protease ATP-binding subunit ClpX